MGANKNNTESNKKGMKSFPTGGVDATISEKVKEFMHWCCHGARKKSIGYILKIRK